MVILMSNGTIGGVIGIGILGVILELLLLAIIVWYIILPAISMIAKMFGFPG